MCSFSTRIKSECGSHCSSVENVMLTKCKDDIRGHLSSCHLSWENIEEYELILARAGLFDVPESQLEKMWVCPRHRNALGKEWRPLRSCQYPTHPSEKKKVKGSHVVQLKLAKEIHKMHGVTVEMGSRKYSICQHMIGYCMCTPALVGEEITLKSCAPSEIATKYKKILTQNPYIKL